ncbi:tetratricopeptide repeat protein [Nitratidesulfovibrio sp. 1201_IL3209]|uniref:tetratricopeptide repeat protein n=1 Tax=Nitratidesulfovibrio sp. 1201_IL3209 TaxID=3084053 RepID=UPI002FDADCAD
MPDTTPSASILIAVSVRDAGAPARRSGSAVARAVCLAALACLLLAGCAVPRIGIYQDPLSGPEHLELGRAYEQKGELDLARREYAEAVRDGLPQAHLYLANVLFQKGDLDEAESHYRSAIRALPEAESAPARNNLAWLLLTRGQRLDEAQQLAEDAVRLADDAHRASFEDTLKQVEAARNR